MTKYYTIKAVLMFPDGRLFGSFKVRADSIVSAKIAAEQKMKDVWPKALAVTILEVV